MFVYVLQHKYEDCEDAIGIPTVHKIYTELEDANEAVKKKFDECRSWFPYGEPTDRYNSEGKEK